MGRISSGVTHRLDASRRRDAKEQNEGRDSRKYAAFMWDYLTELLTNCGKIDILWFDFTYGKKPDAAILTGVYPPVTMKDWMTARGKDAWERSAGYASEAALRSASYRNREE